MTRDEILAMEPGRELDEKIDVLLFGMEFRDFPYGRMCYRNGGWNLAKPYSNDLSAAWEVVEKVARGNNNCSFYLEFHYEMAYAHFGNGEVTGYKTAPEAICKAALIAVLDIDSTEPAQAE